MSGQTGSRGMTRYESVTAAIEVAGLGHKSKVATLKTVAERYFGGTISYQHVVSLRLQWRRENGVDGDCRTYNTQYRRNMLQDDFVEIDQLELLQEHLDYWGIPPESFVEIIESDFHSLENVISVAKKLSEFRKPKMRRAA